jgi:hypothetical protein
MVKLLLRRDLSCLLKHCGSEAAIKNAFDADDVAIQGVNYIIERQYSSGIECVCPYSVGRAVRTRDCSYVDLEVVHLSETLNARRCLSTHLLRTPLCYPELSIRLIPYGYQCHIGSRCQTGKLIGGIKEPSWPGLVQNLEHEG